MSKTTDSISSTCVLCCGSIKYYAVGPCNHHICLKCSTRMRVLCEQKYCAVCRAEMPKVIATAKLHPYNGIISHKYPMDHKAGIAFANPKIRDEFRRLLWEACQLCPLRPPEKTFKELQDHLRREHELFYCDLCIKHLKVFSFERKAYSRKDLGIHRRKGDSTDTSHRGHPLCEFCDERYFDNDELLRHLRRQHYFCHFCETDGVSNQYYNDYENLKEHFREQHYLCEEGQCVEEQFTHAFRSSIDLKAHRATAHSSQMSRAQARQMRQIDVEINLPPRNLERGGGPVFSRGRDRRYHGNRDEDLSTAIQASLDTERREVAERTDARRRDREERDARRTKEKSQPKKKQAASAEPEDARDTVQSKPGNEKVDDTIRGAVAKETEKKEAGINEETRRMRKKGGRTSPQLEGEAEAELEDVTKCTSSNSTESTEDGSRKPKSDESLPDQTGTSEEKCKKEKKKKTKTVSDKTGSSGSENEASQSTKKPVDNKLPQSAASNGVQSGPPLPVSEAAELNAKSVRLAWASPAAKVDDFPTLGKPVGASAVSNGTGNGRSFYDALQKMDTQPKPQKQPAPIPAQRSFTNKDEDFPTLSSIAGILGVDPAPSKISQSTVSKSNSSSAWSTPKEKPVAQPAETKPSTAKSKKKGKKSAKEIQNIVVSEPHRSPPPGFDAPKKENILPSSQTTVPERPPPGLPPGLPPRVPTSTAAQPVSLAPPPSAAASFPVGPPPGFGASFSMTDYSLPPDLYAYIPPPNFQERNLTLATKIKDYLGNREVEFGMFRTISRRYREGSMTAMDYYKECRMLLGDNLPKIFNELVSLLPDVIKQQELMAAQNDLKVQEERQKDDGVLKISAAESGRAKGKGRGSGVWKLNTSVTSSCPQCSQVIKRSELEAHLNMHKEFPSLSAGATSKRQPIPAAAPTWPRLK